MTAQPSKKPVVPIKALLVSGLCLIAAVCAVAALPYGPPGAAAQGLANLQPGDEPLEVYAEEGIEWHRDDKLYLARGKARAINGEVTVNADLLKAYYRESEESSSEIYLLIAEGNVLIESANEIVTGETANYSLDDAVMVMRGSNLKLVTKDGKDTITARDSLEYWEQRKIAVARGAAQAVHEDKKINAEVLVAHFIDGASEKLQVERVEGKGDVRIRTPTDYVVGEEGIYFVAREFATLRGGVKITRDENQMNGEYAEVDMATGISKLLGSPPGSADKGRVHGLILPKARPKGADQPGNGGAAAPEVKSESGGTSKAGETQ